MLAGLWYPNERFVMVGGTGGGCLLYGVGTEATLRRYLELCLHVSVVGGLPQHFLHE